MNLRNQEEKKNGSIYQLISNTRFRMLTRSDNRKDLTGIILSAPRHVEYV